MPLAFALGDIGHLVREVVGRNAALLLDAPDTHTSRCDERRNQSAHVHDLGRAHRECGVRIVVRAVDIIRKLRIVLLEEAHRRDPRHRLGVLQAEDSRHVGAAVVRGDEDTHVDTEIGL